MSDATEMTVEDLRASAEHLRAVLQAIDSGTLEASGLRRAFIAGALLTLQLAFLDAPGLNLAADG